MSRLKKINGLLLKRVPGVRLCARRLVVTPTDDLLRSFLIDTTSGRNLVCVVAAVMPLYSHMGADALNYGVRLQGPVTETFHIDPDDYEKSADTVAAAILTELPKLQRMSRASHFLEHIAYMSEGRDPDNILQFVLAHARIGNYREAMRMLTRARSALEDQMPSNRARLEPLVTLIERELANNPSGLEPLMEEWKAKNIALCQIEDTMRAPLTLAQS